MRNLIDALNAHAYELIDAQIFHAMRFQVADVLRCDAVNAHCLQLIRIGMFMSLAS